MMHMGHARLDCQEFVTRTLSLIQWAITNRQVRGCAASLSPKTRPKVHLPAHSAPRAGEIRSQRRAQREKRTGFLMADASHSMAKPAPPCTVHSGASVSLCTQSS